MWKRTFVYWIIWIGFILYFAIHFLQTKYCINKCSKSAVQDHQLPRNFTKWNDTVQHILVVASWRTGSTLIGNIIASHPSVFYNYEPFFYFKENFPDNTTLVVNHLRKFFQCNFYGLDTFLEKTQIRQFLWIHNQKLWPFCHAFKTLCKSPTFLASICNIFPIQLIKTVRITLKQSALLLKESNLNLKIIFLVRDPRGVMNSRYNQNWCVDSVDCIDSNALCRRMEEDYIEAKKLQNELPDKLYILRYEDLISHPYKKTDKLFQFLGMEMSKDVKQFLTYNTISFVSHANPEIAVALRKHGGLYGHWSSDLEYEEIQAIQNDCEKAMDLFGYNLIENEDDRNLWFSAVGNFSL